MPKKQLESSARPAHGARLFEEKPARLSMYTLYYSPGGANMIVHAALEDIGVPYELSLIDLDKGDQHSPAYRKINPHGRVPAFRVDGKILLESGAILAFLADRHAAAELAPDTQSTNRGRYYYWLQYLSNTLQEALMQYWHPDFYVNQADLQGPLKTDAEDRIGRILDYIDHELSADGPYLLGKKFSAVDYQLAVFARWCRHLAKPATSYSHIRRALDLITARPAWQRMIQQEGLA